MRSIPLPVWRLMIAYALMMGGTALTVLIAGIVGEAFAPSPGLATLPIALVIIGVAVATLPTGRLLDRFGRRTVFLGYGVVAIASALLGAWSLALESFPLYCLTSFIMGWSAAAGHQYRFAALEMVPPALAARATSVLLLGGILGAFIGPEMAVRGRDLLSTEYAGSYLLLACGYVLGMCIIAFYREQAVAEDPAGPAGRPLREILRSPTVVLAIGVGAVAYALMSFLMTATPISMHSHAGHSLEATKWVIQSHIAAMYVPSLFFAALLDRFGFRVLLWLGFVAMALTLLVAFAGTALVNYWVSLALLGLGWNFLFLCGTNLLAHGYRPNERFRVQSLNDFLVFSVQALVSLGSGWFLFQVGWTGLLTAGLLPLAVLLLLLLTTPVFRQLADRNRGPADSRAAAIDVD